MALPIPPGDLGELEALSESGRYVRAHALAEAHHGPLRAWSGGVAALVFGARLAADLGGDRLSHALILRARRRSADPETTPAERADAALCHAYRTWHAHGPLALHRFFRRPGVRAAFDAGAGPFVRASVLCLQAHIAAAYSDTDAAETHWQQAHAFAPDHPWMWTERAALLVRADRYAKALAAARESLRLRPWYRPAVQQSATVLTLLGRDEEALELLQDALDPEKGGLESSGVAAQAAELWAALRQPHDVLRALDHFEVCSPLLEEQGRLWLASRRGEALLQLGDLAGAADAGEPLMAIHAFYGKTVPRLRDPKRETARRVLHDVPFVRQHERTCAPAILAALSRFWGQPADHAAITKEICYDGTFDYQQRHWAETHGWAVREFRADFKSTCALLDAGIPFALATTAINSGHLQAVVGYDARRGTVIIRDPHERNEAEILGDEFFERHALWGPRAMAIVPAVDPDAVLRLHASHLAETDLHDGLFRLRGALHQHDRSGARHALAALETLDPKARLTFFAQRELAYYDANDSAALAAVEGLLARFPCTGRLCLEKLTLLRRLGRAGEARAWLETCVAARRPPEPNLWRELARELAADQQELPRARQLLAFSLFHEPAEPEHLRLLAELLWGEDEYAEATLLFRFAATAAGMREGTWQQFFMASRHLPASDEALRLLSDRFYRLHHLSWRPARTLHWALCECGEFAAAESVLTEVLARRPADGELLLFAATVRAANGEHAAAAKLLENARGRAPHSQVSQAAAELADLAAFRL
jgi:predicted Zn-dependent protease